MKWESSFAIGIGAIDHQHQKIFECLLAIENSITKRDPWHILRFFLSQLSESMTFHFAVEEALLEITRYPGLRDHCDSHARIITLISELEDKLQRTPSEQSLVAFFEDWFLRHVLGNDREYVAYIRKEFPTLIGAQAN